MIERTYRRESLREILLDLAEEVLRERGADELSLREIARSAGVSHGAPRTHFPDRAALLDALAARGFDRMADGLEAALELDADYATVLLVGARNTVAFSVENPGLLDVMFSTKAAEPSPAVLAAAERLFATNSAIAARGVAEGEFDGLDTDRIPLLFSGTMQGISNLIASGHVPAGQVDDLLKDVVAMLLGLNGASRARMPR